MEKMLDVQKHCMIESAKTYTMHKSARSSSVMLNIIPGLLYSSSKGGSLLVWWLHVHIIIANSQCSHQCQLIFTHPSGG